MNNNKVDQLVQTAWQWHLKEETGLETTTLATQGLQRQDETVEFTSTNMSSRQSSRLRGEAASANTEDEADRHRAETRTPSAGSKRAPATSLTPDRDRSTQVQNTHDLPPDEQMQENPAQVTPMGTAKTDTPSDTGLNLSAANFPPLSPLKQKNPGTTNTEPPLAEPPAVPRIPEGKEAQANTSSQQDTSNKPPETDQQVHAPSKEAEFSALLANILNNVCLITGEGVGGFMKLPHKDTRFFQHQMVQNARYYPANPRGV